ncbi:hypothetical protein ACT3TP_02700 [Glutamicibacter sp. AOP38-B1-38]|uniref:hypothetical protein n=1 Tax=Glutamicibacter sp. AOP38-B1-38 TaxID=3457680 RepID=UPI0040335846
MDTPSSGSRHPDTNRGGLPDRKIPRWVKVFVVIAVVLVAFLLVALLSGGEHGPGRHFSAQGMVSGMIAVDLP